MRSFADLPIRRKLSLAFTLTIVVVVVLSCTSVFIYEYMAVRRALSESIATSARITADNSTAVIAFRDADGAALILEALRGESQITAAALFDAEGARLAAYAVPDRTAPERLEEMKPGVHFRADGLICVQPVVEHGRHLGTLLVEAGLSRMYARWGAYGLVVFCVALVAALVGAILCTMLQRRIEKPIQDLADTARAITAHQDFSLRTRVQGRDEIGELAEAINAMLARIEAGIAEKEASAAEILELNAHLEQRVRARTAELEEANRELESFSYSVSHDLRAPLRHIQGYAEMLMRATKDSLSDKARRYVNVIIDASSEMGQLIDDLLTFSRMGRAEMRNEILGLAELFEAVRQQFEFTIRDRDVTWEIDALPQVIGDSPMIKSVLSNLVGNALKFTRTRATTRIEFRYLGAQQGLATFCVRDNGVGFDMAYADKLFGVFQRLHRADEFEGTGIGLANVRRIIVRHGGTVWAEGQPDAGASFFFTLPVVASPAFSRPEIREQAQAHSPC